MSNTRRRRQRRAAQQKGATSAAPSTTVDRFWSVVVQPSVLGGALLVSGALAMSAPFFKLPARKAASFFSDPVQATDLLQIVILLGVAVVVLGLGALLQAWLVGARREGRHMILATCVAGLGAVGVLGTWLSLMTDVPATQAAFGLGEQVEYVVGKVRGKPVRIMLPQRVKVLSLERPEDDAAPSTSALLTFELTQPKQRDVEPTKLQVGESIDVDGTRLTFVGTSSDVKQLRVVLTGQSAQSIEAAAKKGDSVRVTLDGPEYEVKDISLNYMGMGPAAQLTTEEQGAFWVFGREPRTKVSEEAPALFDHGLRLLRVESAPAAVMTVGPVRPFEPLVASGALLLLGVGGLMFLGGAMRDEREDAADNEEGEDLARRQEEEE